MLFLHCGFVDGNYRGLQKKVLLLFRVLLQCELIVLTCLPLCLLILVAVWIRGDPSVVSPVYPRGVWRVSCSALFCPFVRKGLANPIHFIGQFTYYLLLSIPRTYCSSLSFSSSFSGSMATQFTPAAVASACSVVFVASCTVCQMTHDSALVAFLAFCGAHLQVF